MSGTVDIKVEIDIIPVLNMMHGLTETAMQNAWRRTLRKTANWVKSQTAKAVSRETRIPQKLLRHRLYFFLRSRDTGKVWLGLNAFKASQLGKIRQTRNGVTAGRFRFDGAWIMRKVAPNGPVYRRMGKGRTPYEKVKFDWSGPGEAAFREAASRVEERVQTILRQEINYEIQKAAGRAR